MVKITERLLPKDDPMFAERPTVSSVNSSPGSMRSAKNTPKDTAGTEQAKGILSEKIAGKDGEGV